MPTPEHLRREHDEYQRRYFDQHCDIFKLPIPQDVETRTREIVRAANLNALSRVLDVGTGMGVLIKHFLEEGVEPQNITGCDLSMKMLAEARQRYPGVNFWQGDIVDFPAGVNGSGNFDAVFFNACFGNIFDQHRAIDVASRALKNGGVVIISHPLGNQFVEKLKQQNANLVLTLMPDRTKLEQFCSQSQLTIKQLQDVPDFYLVVLSKTAH